MEIENPYASPRPLGIPKLTRDSEETQVLGPVPGVSTMTSFAYVYLMLYYFGLEIVLERPQFVLAMSIATLSGVVSRFSGTGKGLRLSVLAHMLAVSYPYSMMVYAVYANWSDPRPGPGFLIVLPFLVIEGPVLIWLIAKLIVDRVKT